MKRERFNQRTLKNGFLFSILISMISLVAVLSKTINLKTLANVKIEPLFLLLALTMVFLSWVQETWRLGIIARLFHEDVPFWRMMRIVLATIFAAGVTPFASGQGPVQVYLLHRERISYGRSAAILSVRLFLTTLSFSILTPLVAILFRSKLALDSRIYSILDLAVVLSLAFSLLGIAILVRPHRIRVMLLHWARRSQRKKGASNSLRKNLLMILRELRELETAFSLLRRTPPVSLILPFLLTVSYWVFYFVTTPLLIMALGFNPPWEKVIGLQLIFTYLLSYVPVPGASGAAEVGFASLFAKFIPGGFIGLFVSLWRLFTYYLGLLAGGAALFVLVKDAEK